MERVKEFNKRPTLNFSEITPDFLEQFCAYYLRKNYKLNTVAIYCRYIRTMFNLAIDEYNVNIASPVILNYPFRKFKITTDWKDFPTLDSNLVDYNPSLGDVPGNAKAAAWIKAFYEINAFYPVWLKLIFAQENIFSGSTPIAAGNVPVTSSYTDAATTPSSTYDGVYNAFMTTFTYDINKRRQGYDYVNLKIEFTEI